MKFKRFLVPIDITDQYEKDLFFATQVASLQSAELVFLYVAFTDVSDDIYHRSDIDPLRPEERRDFYSIKPTMPNIKYRNFIRLGSPGAAIVKAAAEFDCDLVLMATSGPKSVMQWILGSVAEYVVRNSECPVLTFQRENVMIEEPAQDANSSTSQLESQTFLFNSNHQSKLEGKKHFDANTQMTKIADYLVENPGSDFVVITECENKAIGIISTDEVENYISQKRRLREGDQTVLNEVYKVDEFGLFRVNEHSFELAKSHINSDLSSILTPSPQQAISQES